MKTLLRLFIILGFAGGLLLLASQFTDLSAQGLFSNGNANSQDDIVVARGQVETGSLTVSVSATGSLSPARQVPLVFEASAPLVEVLVRSGDQVSAGDVLARLDTLDIEATLLDARTALNLQQLIYESLTTPPRDVDIAVAEAAVQVAQASYNAAFQSQPNESDIEIARLQAELARNQLWQSQLQGGQQGVPALSLGFSIDDLPQEIIDNIPDGALDNLSNLFMPGDGGAANQLSQVQRETGLTNLEYSIDIAQTNYEATLNRGPDLGSLNSANAARTQAQIALDRLVNGPSETDLRLAQIDLRRAELAFAQAELLLSRTELIAPFDGVISQNNLVIGELPPSTNPAMTLIDTGEFFVELPVDETDIVNIEQGQRVVLTLDALPNAEVTGTVERAALIPLSVGQLVSYPVRVRLDPTDAPIRAGMSVTARITTQELTDVLLVQNRFIRIDRNTQNAFVTVERSNGRFEEVQVELGVRGELASEIISGLEAGEEIVLLPRATFIPGVN